MLDWSAPLPEVHYPAGAVLIREGEVHGKLFVLLDGAVEISRSDTLLTVVDAPGAIFGEMSALLGSATTTTAAWSTPCSSRCGTTRRARPNRARSGSATRPTDRSTRAAPLRPGG